MYSAVGFSEWSTQKMVPLRLDPQRLKASSETASQALDVLPTAFQYIFTARQGAGYINLVLKQTTKRKILGGMPVEYYCEGIGCRR